MSPESEFTFTTTKTTTTIQTTTLPPTLESLSNTLADTFVHYLNYLGKVPGGDWLLWYIKASYKDDPVRSLFELALFLFGVYYFFNSRRKENKSDLVTLSKREIDELIDEWNPVEIVDEVTPIEKWQMKSLPVVKGHNGARIQLENLNKAKDVVNLASNDFLNLNESEELKTIAKSVINYSGVGACSAPNFYGTQDFHVRLEEDLTDYLHGENSILYGQDFVTPSSVLPAFVKRGDVCVVDTGVNIAIQKALVVSRCEIEWYHHNDMKHLENLLKEITPTLDKQKPLKRRFIVTEAIFSNGGSLLDLPKVVELRKKYKYRLFLDESNSIGVLGNTGRGITEYFGIPRSDVSITVGTLANSLASSGGFCVGASPMVHHQRLSSLAYVFSASLPPYCAKVACQAIKEIKKLNSNGKSILISKLHENTKFLHEGISSAIKDSNFVEVISNINSPVIQLSLKGPFREAINLPEFYGNTSFLTTARRSKYNNPFDEKYNLENFILQKIVDQVLASSNILISRSKNLLVHEHLPVAKPRLMVYANTGVSIEDLSLLIRTINGAVNTVCGSINRESSLDTLTSEMKVY
ncbi:serine palmitoyltransferase component [Yamadazyma tenuis]|uniref:serine C-palmitoyltransferase n=1 Tax=Candida tenuis (strain ATCC 10573 / BCRC 21748 / CBS 615 / JCM 9827 / NBRC 10315 / NRRL Y-1498 / VKM Y-70) TaxID=590646 RepID=G3AYA5_CANTC|nr:serine palmitoyltransferase component [Yamadazyma tenuis ATCC 10573]EGV65804.1 serine palmitoyltransferase component [Yamadazyma tenuis ATCC 10573]WEJ95867.1 serine palmitoyltransferase component [Yamadazyma tenuis]